MTSVNLPILPPSSSHESIKYLLSIGLNGVQLFDRTHRPVSLKVKFWGLKNHQIISIGEQTSYGINTSSQAFKQYLTDMKVLPLQLFDQRNQEQIGNGALNWQLYLNKNQQQCPFIQNQLSISLPFKSVSKKTSSEVQLTIKYRKQQITPPLQSQINVIQDYSQEILTRKEFKQKQQPKIKEQKRVIVNSVRPSIFQAPQYLEVSRPRTNLKLSMKSNKSTKNVNFQPQNHQFELTQLKLEAYEFFNQPIHQPQQNNEIIMIHFLKMNKKNQFPQYLDLIILEGSNKRHTRLFPSNQQYKETICTQKDSIIEVKNQLCFTSFYVSELKRQNQLQLRNKKQQIVGKITISKLNTFQPQPQPQPLPKPLSTLLPQPQKIIKQSIQIPQPSYLLITMKDVQIQHNYRLCIKNYQWQYPYSNFHIIPTGQLGKVFALEVRNMLNQSLSSIILSSYRDIKPIRQSLRCIVVHDRRVEIGSYGTIWLKIELGFIQQLNQTLNKMKPKKQKTQSQKIETEENQSEKGKKMIKKLQTQSNPRIDTEPISQFKMEEEQLSNEVYLVEMLSRFLHHVKMNQLPQTHPTTKLQFENLMNSLLEKEHMELATIIVDVFVVQDDKINFQEFVRCGKSYHNFLQLWWTIRSVLLCEIIEHEPQCQKWIESQSQLGTISRSTLWRKALPHTPPQLRTKLQKLYNITDILPLQTKILLQDIGKARSKTSKLPLEPQPQLISDLGKLVKQTLEGLIGEGCSINYEQVNIKVMCQILQGLSIKISYWQALMVIEQLKGWYGVDMEMGEGIISSITVQTWLKSSAKKVKPKSPPKEWKQEQIIENKSVAKSQLNDDQIFNIANLLRENDNFRMPTIQSQINKENIEAQKILDSSIQVVPSSKYIKITLNSLKLKEQLSTFKLELRVTPFNLHYYYIRQQLDGKTIVELLQMDWKKHTKGIEIKLISDRHIYGILPVDQLQHEKKSKTIILYQGKNIVGKLTITYQFCKERPIINFTDKVHPVTLRVGANTKLQSQKLTVSILDNKFAILFDEDREVSLPSDYYKQQLLIEIQGYGSCLVPLQQLYLNNKIQGVFPIISQNEGLFMCNINVSIHQQSNLLTQAMNNRLESVPSVKIEHHHEPLVLMLDSISTLNLGSCKNRTILGSIIVRSDGKIVYKNDGWLQHEVKGHWNITYFKDKYFRINSNEQLQFQMEYESRSLGKGTLKGTSSYYYVQLQNKQILMYLGLRSIKLSENVLKYPLERLYKVISNRIVCEQGKNSQLSQEKYASIKGQYSLTLTQVRLLKELVSLNRNIVTMEESISQSQKHKLIQQLIYNDVNREGILPFSTLASILEEIMGSRKLLERCYYQRQEGYRYGQLLEYVSRAPYRSENVREKVDILYQQIKNKYK